MTLMQIPKIYGVDKIRLYDNNTILTETWMNSTSRVEESPELKKYINREIDYIEMCIEGCIGEILVMEIFLK